MCEKINVIVAHDHPIFRDGVCAVLKRQEFIGKISQAGDGNEVIKLLGLEHYDVIMMDIRMEPMNGLKAMEIISKQFPDVKVIALSMFNEEKYVMDMMNKGASGYLLKNASKQEILQAIKNVSRGGTYYSQSVAESLLGKLKTNHKMEEQGSPAYEARIREIIFLMCMEKTSKEIADLMNLSVRTIEDYRSDILSRTNSKNIVGVIKFAMQSGIIDDEILKNKFYEKLG